MKIESTDCSAQALKSAYHKLALKVHPDIPRGSAAAFIELKDAFDFINEYKIDKKEKADSLPPSLHNAKIDKKEESSLIDDLFNIGVIIFCIFCPV